MKARDRMFIELNFKSTKENREEKKTNTTNKSFVQLRIDIDSWNNNFYVKANEKLYEVLGSIYDYYVDYSQNATDEKSIVAELQEAMTNEEIKFSKNEKFISLLSKYVFKNIDPKRISVYKKILTIAINEKIDSGKKLPAFIKDAGGVEKLRTANTKNSSTMADRSANAKSQIKGRKTICRVTNKLFKSIAATGEDNLVVLVGYIDSKGVYQAKHVVFENKVEGLNNVPSKTVIDAALSNMQTLTNNISKAESKKSVKATVNTKKLAELSK